MLWDPLILGSTAIVIASLTGMVLGARRWRRQSPRRLMKAGATLGMQGDLQDGPQGPRFDGQWHGRSARITDEALTLRLVVALPELPTDVFIKPRDLSPAGKSMTVPEARFRERIAARGNPVGLHGVLTPALRNALAHVNSSLIGPRVWIEDGRLKAEIPPHAEGDALKRVAPYLNRILEQLTALPSSPAARLLARLQDEREHVTMRARALRLLLSHRAKAPPVQTALAYAQSCGVPELEGLARAAVSQDALPGRLSVVEPEDEEGALSLSEGAGGLGLVPRG